MFFWRLSFLLLAFRLPHPRRTLVFLFSVGVGRSLGVVQPVDFGSLPNRLTRPLLTNESLVAVPPFFMGVMLERARSPNMRCSPMDRCSAICAVGLVTSVSAGGAMLAASTGVVGATVVTHGLISLPANPARGIDPKLAHRRHLRPVL